MLYRSPSVSAIGSPSNLEAFVFFRGPICSILHSCLNCVGVVLGSTPSAVSFIPCPMVRSSRLSSYVMVAPAAALFSAAFTTAREALTSSMSCLFRFCYASSLVASFYLCITTSSHATRFEVCHLGGHESSTTKVVSSIAMNESLVQFCSGSFPTLIYTLCTSALKFAKCRRLSYTVGDRHSRFWIHIRTLTSMSIQKILIS